MLPSFDDGRLCGGSRMDPKEFDKLFFFGPPMAYKKPAAPTKELWEEAKAICRLCPVYEACRDSSRGDEFGVVGGTDQYERYLARRAESKRILALPWEQREPFAERAHRLYYGHNSLAKAVVAMTMGLTPPAIGKLAAQYKERLDNDRPATAGRRYMGAVGAEERALILSLREQGMAVQAITLRTGRTKQTVNSIFRQAAAEAAPPFPSGLPDADGWVRHDGAFRKAHYVGETPDGRWFYLKFQPDGLPMIKWVPSADFELRRPVTPVQIERVGRGDRGARSTKRKAA